MTPHAPFPKIRLRNLRKSFGEKLVLDGIDLDIMSETSMVVIGGSGSGKSVLLKCILGLLEADAGTIEIDGTDILTLPRREQEEIRARIGMLFRTVRCSTACRSGRTLCSACSLSVGCAARKARPVRPSSLPRSVSPP